MNPKPVTWNGITYASVTEAARACNLTTGGMSHRLASGYTCDDDLKHASTGGVAKSCLWNGVVFASQQEAAETFEVNPSTMRLWKGKGYICDDDVPERTVTKPCGVKLLSGLDVWAQRAKHRREREAGTRWVREAGA